MVSRNITEALVDKNGEIRVFAPGVGWSASDGRAFRPIEGLSMAVDALGRFWTGTHLGPEAPEEMRYAEGREGRDAALQGGTQHRSDRARRPNRSLNARYSLVVSRPEPPRCRKLDFTPAPTLKVSVTQNRGGARQREIALLEEVGSDARTAVVYGFTLTWRFEPIPRGACLERWEQFYEERRHREGRVASLFAGWLVAAIREQAALNLEEAIRLRMETEKIEHMMRIAGGRIRR
jgi:hypothetical protein